MLKIHLYYKMWLNQDNLTAVIFILLASLLFSKIWVELSGKSGRDIAKSLRDNQYFLEGIRESEENVFE